MAWRFSPTDHDGLCRHSAVPAGCPPCCRQISVILRELPPGHCPHPLLSPRRQRHSAATMSAFGCAATVRWHLRQPPEFATRALTVETHENWLEAERYLNRNGLQEM